MKICNNIYFFFQMEPLSFSEIKKNIIYFKFMNKDLSVKSFNWTVLALGCLSASTYDCVHVFLL